MFSRRRQDFAGNLRAEEGGADARGSAAAAGETRLRAFTAPFPNFPCANFACQNFQCAMQCGNADWPRSKAALVCCLPRRRKSRSFLTESLPSASTARPRTHARTHLRAHTRARARARIQVCTDAPSQHTRAHTDTKTQRHTHTHARACAHTHMAHTRAREHTRALTHAHTDTRNTTSACTHARICTHSTHRPTSRPLRGLWSATADGWSCNVHYLQNQE